MSPKLCACYLQFLAPVVGELAPVDFIFLIVTHLAIPG